MLTFTNKGKYLLAELSGKYSLKFFIESIHEIIDRSKKSN